MFKKAIFTFVALILFLIFFSMLGQAPQREDVSWGVTFSQKYAIDLGLDWQETYLAIIEDLGAKSIRVPIYWDFVEQEEGVYDFDDIDWIFDKALEKDVKLIPVIGMRIPRWPECHLPYWAVDLEKEKQQEKILMYLEEFVSRYADTGAVLYWQVENEPFLTTFGECPWADKDFLKKEVDLVKEIDPKTPVLITESGELSTWFKAAKYGDIVGSSIYRQNWWHAVGGGYYKYPITPAHYFNKARLIDKMFDKEVICVELQAEPWGPAPTFIISLEEQAKSMDINRFRDNIAYAKKTGFSEFYLWGGEWWYWMKEKHNQDDYWVEAKKLFD